MTKRRANDRHPAAHHHSRTRYGMASHGARRNHSLRGKNHSDWAQCERSSRENHGGKRVRQPEWAPPAWA